jgi:hypothetical protein
VLVADRPAFRRAPCTPANIAVAGLPTRIYARIG